MCKTSHCNEGEYYVSRTVLMLLFLSAATCGCGAISSRLENTVPANKLVTEGKGIVLVHTSLHDQSFYLRCDGITATVAKADTSGQYGAGQEVHLKGLVDLLKTPSQMTLAVGKYGIVQLACYGHKRTDRYNAPIAKRGGRQNGTDTIYERPIVTFTVGAGEIVDIGSLQVPSRTVREKAPPGVLGRPKGEFIALVRPMPEEWLQNLAKTDPDLFNARISRPMKVPAQG